MDIVGVFILYCACNAYNATAECCRKREGKTMAARILADRTWLDMSLHELAVTTNLTADLWRGGDGFVAGRD